jgi:hypothetical protein
VVKATRPETWRQSVSGKAAGEDGWGETESEMSKAGEVDSSLSERPEHHRPRRLADWINPTGAIKVHSLIDKVYKRKNLEIAWKRVKANQGAGGIDGESIEAFGEGLEERLARLHEELRTDNYIPQPVRQQRIPKAGKPGEWRVLGIPTIYDRVCQQALLNRLVIAIAAAAGSRGGQGVSGQPQKNGTVKGSPKANSSIDGSRIRGKH